MQCKFCCLSFRGYCRLFPSAPSTCFSRQLYSQYQLKKKSKSGRVKVIHDEEILYCNTTLKQKQKIVILGVRSLEEYNSERDDQQEALRLPEEFIRPFLQPTRSWIGCKSWAFFPLCAAAGREGCVPLHHSTCLTPPEAYHQKRLFGLKAVTVSVVSSDGNFSFS